jgi:murein L,D-transpeptidase YcbB/YkuD
MPSTKLDRRLMLGSAAALAFSVARPARAEWSAVPEPIMRLHERLRGLDADGLDPTWYGLPAREAAMSDPAGFQSATHNAARQALADLLHGRAMAPPGRVDIRRDTPALPLNGWMSELAGSAEPAQVISRAADLPAGQAALRAAMTEARAREARGALPAVPSGGIIEPGRFSERVPALRARLAATDPVLAAAPVAEPNMYDDVLAEAVRRFQNAAGLEADGRVGAGTQMALNRTASMDVRALSIAMDLRRAAPEPGRERRIEVNIPDFMLHVYEGQKVVLEMPVIIGRPQRATPLLTTRLTSVQFNPPWGVPVRNAVEDKLPLLQRNPLALVRNGTRIFQRVDGEQVEVDPTTVEWRNYSRTNFPFTMRQDPGEANALGRIKFVMPNSEDIFMHDTPERHLFARSERAFSSGCVRLGRPMDFLAMAVEGMEGWDRNRMARSVSDGRTFGIALRRQPSVRLIYRTTVVENGQVRIRPDLYGHDEAYWRAMERGPARPMAARA